MKKVINGKVYNTETAQEIGRHWNGYSRSDFNYCVETLYKTKKGAFFIHGDGGANSRYNRFAAGMYCGAEDIVLISDEDARQWMEQYLEADEYIKHFGEEEG